MADDATTVFNTFLSWVGNMGNQGERSTMYESVIHIVRTEEGEK